MNLLWAVYLNADSTSLHNILWQVYMSLLASLQRYANSNLESNPESEPFHLHSYSKLEIQESGFEFNKT